MQLINRKRHSLIEDAKNKMFWFELRKDSHESGPCVIYVLTCDLGRLPLLGILLSSERYSWIYTGPHACSSTICCWDNVYPCCSCNLKNSPTYRRLSNLSLCWVQPRLLTISGLNKTVIDKQDFLIPFQIADSKGLSLDVECLMLEACLLLGA